MSSAFNSIISITRFQACVTLFTPNLRHSPSDSPIHIYTYTSNDRPAAVQSQWGRCRLHGLCHAFFPTPSPWNHFSIHLHLTSSFSIIIYPHTYIYIYVTQFINHLELIASFKSPWLSSHPSHDFVCVCVCVIYVGCKHTRLGLRVGWRVNSGFDAGAYLCKYRLAWHGMQLYRSVTDGFACMPFFHAHANSIYTHYTLYYSLYAYYNINDLHIYIYICTPVHQFLVL